MTRKRIKVRHETSITWNFTIYGPKGIETNLPEITNLGRNPHIVAANAYSTEGSTQGVIRLTFANPANLGVVADEMRPWRRENTVRDLIERTEMWHTMRITDDTTSFGKSSVASDGHDQVSVDLPFVLTRGERSFCLGVFSRMRKLFSQLGIPKDQLRLGHPHVAQTTDVWDKDSSSWVPYGTWFARRFLDGLDVA